MGLHFDNTLYYTKRGHARGVAIASARGDHAVAARGSKVAYPSDPVSWMEVTVSVRRSGSRPPRSPAWTLRTVNPPQNDIEISEASARMAAIAGTNPITVR